MQLLYQAVDTSFAIQHGLLLTSKKSIQCFESAEQFPQISPNVLID